MSGRGTVRRPLDLRATLCVVGLCLVWGFQQVAMKTIVTEIAPVMQLALRFLGSTLFFGSWLALREGRAAFGDGALRSGVLLGLLFSLEFLLLGEALRYTSAAHAIVFLYAAPVFTALGLQYLPDELLRPTQWLGIGIAFAGIGLAFLDHSQRSLAELLRGDLLALLAGAGWGFSNVVLRRGRIGMTSTVKTVFCQVSIAAAALLAYAHATGQDAIHWSPGVVAVMVYHTAVVAIGSYLVWFWLLRHYLTSRLMLLSFLTPIFGVLFGAVVLHESVAPRFALGALLALAGMLAVNWRQLFPRATA